MVPFLKIEEFSIIHHCIPQISFRQTCRKPILRKKKKKKKKKEKETYNSPDDYYGTTHDVHLD